MKMTTFFRFIFVIGTIACWATSCSDEISGGTGTETINTFAMLPDGTPARGATVQVVDARWWIDSINNGVSPVLGQGITDKNGSCSMTIPSRKGLVNLQIDHVSSGLLLPIAADESSDLGPVQLKAYASIAGSFADSAAISDSAFLAGTSYKAAIINHSSFSFTNVPPGPTSLLCIKKEATHNEVVCNTSFSLTSGVTCTLSTGLASQKRLLIDNFESGVGPTSLGAIIPLLGWYVLSDSLYYFWDPKTCMWKQGPFTPFGQSPIEFDSISDNNGGHAFTYSTTLDAKSLKANGLIGFSLKPLGSRGVDLSAMTSFSFKAWGSGTVRIRFETEQLDSVFSGLSQYTGVFKLSESPQKFSIPVDSLEILSLISNPEHYPWSSVSRNVLRIEFNFSTFENERGKKLTLNLDDFFLEGVSLSSLFSSIKQ